MSGHTPSEEGPGSIDGERLATDRLFELLRERERRQVVAFLRDADGPVAVSTLAEHVAAGGDDRAVRRTLVGLDHVHLPRLAAAGVVDYDRDAGTVRYRGDDRLESLLAVAEGVEAEHGDSPGP